MTPAFVQESVPLRELTRAVIEPSPVSVEKAYWKASEEFQMSTPEPLRV